MSSTPPAILIIDDEEIIREALEALLMGEGYAVTTAATAADGIEALANRTPDGGPAQSADWSVTIGYFVPVVPSTKETFIEPLSRLSTETWPYCDS